MLACEDYIESNIFWNGKLATKIIRHCCSLCGAVCSIDILYEDGTAETENTNEFHTACSE